MMEKHEIVAMTINVLENVLSVIPNGDDCKKSKCEFCAGYRIADCKTGNVVVFSENVLQILREESTMASIHPVCPRCKNEEIVSEANFCKICGLDLRVPYSTPSEETHEK